MSEIRVVIADDHTMFRNGMRVILEAEPDLLVVGEAATGDEALERVASQEVDLLILDLSMPGRSGIEVAEQLHRTHPTLPILVLTMHENGEYLRRLLEMGVVGYLLKESSAGVLVQAIRQVREGETFVDPSMTAEMVKVFLGRKPPARVRERKVNEILSKREREICREVALGFSNTEIGERLAISKRTVETHRARLMEKLGLKSRADLVSYALKSGLIVEP